ncbi:hypothetical protein RUND412_004099 [Rhizina undulata]
MPRKVSEKKALAKGAGRANPETNVRLTEVEPAERNVKREIASNGDVLCYVEKFQALYPIGQKWDEPVYFWRPYDVPYGCFSQWYEMDFQGPDGNGGLTKFHTSEQYVAYHKAILFKNDKLAKHILAANDSRVYRHLSRTLQNYDDYVWKEERVRIVEDATYYKFRNNRLPMLILLGTSKREIVEASGLVDDGDDYFYGGSKVQGREYWPDNLLGTTLMETRTRIWKEIDAEDASKEAATRGKGGKAKA